MEEYILFIDTETSGLPKKWDKPYSDGKNWPYSIQIAWLVFSKSGREIKKENFYINNNDFIISPPSYKIHGISSEYLAANGIDRKTVLKLLKKDIESFNPLIVGHFMELDFHVLNADFYRAEMYSPLNGRSFFCTMLASSVFSKNHPPKYLRLNNLYQVLFNENAQNEHNALADAQNTAACFFEMKKNNQINDDLISSQQKIFTKNKLNSTNNFFIVAFVLAVFITILILSL